MTEHFFVVGPSNQLDFNLIPLIVATGYSYFGMGGFAIDTPDTPLEKSRMAIQAMNQADVFVAFIGTNSPKALDALFGLALAKCGTVCIIGERQNELHYFHGVQVFPDVAAFGDWLKRRTDSLASLDAPPLADCAETIPLFEAQREAARTSS